MSERPRQLDSEKRIKDILSALSQKYDFASSSLGTIDFKSAKIKKVLARTEFAIIGEVPTGERALAGWRRANPEKFEQLDEAYRLLFNELGVADSQQ